MKKPLRNSPLGMMDTSISPHTMGASLTPPDIPNSVFLPVYGLEHDYDRDPQRAESKALYQQAITWTNRILGAK